MTHPKSSDYPPPWNGGGPGGQGFAEAQPPVPEQVVSDTASDVDENDPHKVEKLTRAGRDIDPDDGSD